MNIFTGINRSIMMGFYHTILHIKLPKKLRKLQIVKFPFNFLQSKKKSSSKSTNICVSNEILHFSLFQPWLLKKYKIFLLFSYIFLSINFRLNFFLHSLTLFGQTWSNIMKKKCINKTLFYWFHWSHMT